MKKYFFSLLAVLVLSVPCFAMSWWETTFGTAPNIEANVIYAPNLSRQSTYGDFESILWMPKINGNPVGFSAVYVPSTDIGGIGISYDLNNLPASVIDASLLSVFDVTLSVGFVYDSSINRGSATFGARIVKIKFQ